MIAVRQIAMVVKECEVAALARTNDEGYRQGMGGQKGGREHPYPCLYSLPLTST
jgi:hypothetical protein